MKSIKILVQNIKGIRFRDDFVVHFAFLSNCTICGHLKLTSAIEVVCVLQTSLRTDVFFSVSNTINSGLLPFEGNLLCSRGKLLAVKCDLVFIKLFCGFRGIHGDAFPPEKFLGFFYPHWSE